MNTLELKKLLLGTSLLISGFAFAGQANAQQTTQADEDVILIDEAQEVEEELSGDVIVTGSRMKRSTYSSVAPLQIISGDISREAGLIDPADILQGSTASSGQQIDTTFQGFVLDNGPGASTVDLRGFGASRTLTLINGRRVAPAGVEGAPSVPDLNLLPSNLIDRYEVLLDGASSVYGSDAVAGVVNAILKKDFDGLEVEGFIDESEYGGGSRTVSATYGLNTDRAFIGFGAEYAESDEVKLSERPWTDGCDGHYEITTAGEIRTLGIADRENLGQRASDCKRGSLVGRAFFPSTFNGQRSAGFGSVYYIDGQSNTGIGNFNESSLFSVPFDSDGDGEPDVSFVDFSLTNGARNNASLYPDFNRYSLMSYGEITTDQNGVDVTPYFEALYSKRQTSAFSGAPQLFPDVVAENSFNPCGVNAPVDCGLAYDAALRRPEVEAAWRDFYGASATEFLGFGVNVFQGAAGPQVATPIVSVNGDRNFVESEVGQLRLVGGVKFDMPYLEFGSLNGWSGDVSVQHSVSTGSARRTGVNEAKLNFALGQQFDARGVVEPTGGACIEGSNTNLSAADMAGCVPVNMFAPSLYDPLVGSFATQAERDYVFSDRTFDTTYKQTIFSGFLAGNVADLPAGNLTGVVGMEVRTDEIDSDPNVVASQGQLFGFFIDQGAEGKKRTTELYAELGIPLVADKPFFEELDLEIAGRYTKDEFYGGAGTYSAKLGWRPVSSLLLRGTIGTSFRAPNLRELFLKNQSGFNTVFDPCSQPQDALQPLLLPNGDPNPNGGQYDPALDRRELTTLENCRLAGIDPTTFNGNSATGAYSIEINRSGAFFDPKLGLDGLQPETSNSKTVGFAFEQPFTDAFDLNLSASYYDVDLSDTITELSPSFVVFDCYVVETELSSPRCDNVIRGSNGFIQNVTAGFENIGSVEIRGIDINGTISKDLNFMDRAVDVAFDFNVNHALELSRQSFNARTGGLDEEDFVGQPGVPEWKALLRAYANVDDFRFSWTTNYIGGTEVALEDQDPFADLDGGSDTCLGEANGDVDCRDVDFLDDYWIHSASVYYRADTWTAGVGVRNVFDKAPPIVDGSEILATNNTPIGYGYNLNGRTFFANVSKKF